MTVWALAERDSRLPTRLGLAVRAPGRAVVRNRVKRRLREAFRACHCGPGYRVVVRAEASLASRNFQEVLEELEAALREVTRR